MTTDSSSTHPTSTQPIPAHPRKRYIIGDIQGCYDEFLALLEKLRYDPLHHELWLAGDLVNRGPKSMEMLRWAYEHRPEIRLVLGNHDIHAMMRFYGIRPAYADDTLDALLSAPDAETWMDWLRSQPLALFDEHTQCLLVHAGIAPSWNEAQTLAYAEEVSQALTGPDFMEVLKHLYGNTPTHWEASLTGHDRLKVISNYLMRVRFCTLEGGFEAHFKGELDQAPETLKPWYHLADQLKPRTRVVFGHWSALNGETHLPKFINIDTGCVWGKNLTAWSPDTGERIVIPALRSPHQ